MMENGEGSGAAALDYTTQLPPRKRLLAGLKKQNWSFDSAPTFHFNSAALRAQFEGLLHRGNSCPEEVIEASKTAASAAADAAAAARAAALEKMANAMRVKAFARSVLDLVGSAHDERSGKWEDEENYLARRRGKKKRVAVELLYKPKISEEGCDEEEEEDLARRLRKVIKSSSRISRSTGKKNGNSLKSRGRGAVWYDSDYESTSNDAGFLYQTEGSVPLNSNATHLGEDRIEKNGDRLRSNAVIAANRGKVKKKKLLLSQCGNREWKDSFATPESERHTSQKEPNTQCTVGNSSEIDIKPSDVDLKLVETESVWKCKKLKLTQLYSD